MPAVIEAAPPGIVSEGVGGDRKLMKNVNFWIELIASIGVGASGSVMLFGLSAYSQSGSSSRSVMNRSFVMPISFR